jgi:hypothetical protein
MSILAARLGKTPEKTIANSNYRISSFLGNDDPYSVPVGCVNLAGLSREESEQKAAGFAQIPQANFAAED